RIRARERSRGRAGTHAAPAHRRPLLRLAASDERVDRRSRRAPGAGTAAAGNGGGGADRDRSPYAGGRLAVLGEVCAAPAGRPARRDGARAAATRDQCAAGAGGGTARARPVGGAAGTREEAGTQLTFSRQVGG